MKESTKLLNYKYQPKAIAWTLATPASWIRLTNELHFPDFWNVLLSVFMSVFMFENTSHRSRANLNEMQNKCAFKHCVLWNSLGPWCLTFCPGHQTVKHMLLFIHRWAPKPTEAPCIPPEWQDNGTGGELFTGNSVSPSLLFLHLLLLLLTG